MMKTTIVIALVVLALCSVSEGTRRRREATSFVELSGRAQASLCQIKDDSGNIQQWNCPFENPVCCSFAAKACCPNGYYCDESKAPVQCRKGSAPAGVTNSAGVQTINVFPKITINSAPSPAAESSGPSPAAESSGPIGTSTSPSSASTSSVGMGESSMSSPMGESSTQVKVPPFRQNIIIVKNINVLTKAQQPALPPPKESSEESSERSEQSESSESSRQESSERSEQSELSARS